MKIDNDILPSNKKFGYFFSLVFFLIFVYIFYYYSNSNLYLVFLSLCLITILLTIFSPDTLLFFNKIWFRIGMLLNTIVSPVILGFIFFILITPVSLFFKIIRRDYLCIKLTNKESYWIKSEKRKLDKSSLKQQF